MANSDSGNTTDPFMGLPAAALSDGATLTNVTTGTSGSDDAGVGRGRQLQPVGALPLAPEAASDGGRPAEHSEKALPADDQTGTDANVRSKQNEGIPPYAPIRGVHRQSPPGLHL